jgi:hypothetical protein
MGPVNHFSDRRRCHARIGALLSVFVVSAYSHADIAEKEYRELSRRGVFTRRMSRCLNQMALMFVLKGNASQAPLFPKMYVYAVKRFDSPSISRSRPEDWQRPRPTRPISYQCQHSMS